MAAKGRRTDTRVDKDLLGRRPFAFDFFQAVRLLGRILPRRKQVAGDSLPSEETVRFRGDVGLTFPPSAIREIRKKRGIRHITVSFLGLIGRQGVLPFHYTEFLIEQRMKSRDTAAADFFDLFLHRLVSFFYRAWEKHSVAIQYEKEITARAEPGAGLTQYVLDLTGLGTEGLSARTKNIDLQAVVFYSGLLAQRPHSASALEGMLRDYFQAPVRVEQFRGHWFNIDPSEYSEMRTTGLQDMLGNGATLGEAVWNPQARIRLHIGPLHWRQYRQFLPGGLALAKLIAMTRLFLDWSVDFDLQLYLLKDEVPEARLSEDPSDLLALGLSTWLKTSEFLEDAQAVISGEPGMDRSRTASFAGADAA